MTSIEQGLFEKFIENRSKFLCNHLHAKFENDEIAFSLNSTRDDGLIKDSTYKESAISVHYVWVEI